MVKVILLSMMLFAAFFFSPAAVQVASADPQWWLQFNAPGVSGGYGYYGYPYYSYPYYSYYPYQSYWYGYPSGFYNVPFWGSRFGFGHSHDHFRGGHIEHGFQGGHGGHGHGGFNGHGGHHGGGHR